MEEALLRILANPLTGAIFVAAVLAGILYKREQQRRAAAPEAPITDAWVRRIEERVQEVHKLRSILQEILGKAELALSTSREIKAEIARMQAERQPLVERFYHLESEVAALQAREGEHNLAHVLARQELAARLEKIAAELDAETRELRKIVADALARMG